MPERIPARGEGGGGEDISGIYIIRYIGNFIWGAQCPLPSHTPMRPIRGTTINEDELPCLKERLRRWGFEPLGNFFLDIETDPGPRGGSRIFLYGGGGGGGEGGGANYARARTSRARNPKSLTAGVKGPNKEPGGHFIKRFVSVFH